VYEDKNTTKSNSDSEYNAMLYAAENLIIAGKGITRFGFLHKQRTMPISFHKLHVHSSVVLCMLVEY